MHDTPSVEIVLLIQALQTVGTGSGDRCRLATVEGGQGIQVLFDRMFPGLHALHLDEEREGGVKKCSE